MIRRIVKTSLVAMTLSSIAAVGAFGEAFTPPPGKQWVTIASTQDLDAGIGIARLFDGDARVVSTKSGWYAVTLEPRSGSIEQIRKEIFWPALPSDALLSKGANYLETVWRREPLRQASAAVKSGKATTVKMSGVEVTLTREPQNEGWTAHLVGRDPSGIIFDVRHRFDSAADYDSDVRMVELDRSNPTPEVLFDAYTGGAHCCTVTAILTRTGNGIWQVVDLGASDGEGPTLEDVDGDGFAELIRPDNRFLYAFAPYADSMQPILIQRLNSGRIEDATMQPPFRRRLVQDVRQMEFIAKLEPARWTSNGFLAAWVAAKTRIGEGDQAWQKMLSLYNRSSDFGIDVCAISVPMKDCPSDRRRQLPFPEGLRQHMKDDGYGEVENAASPGSAAGSPVSLNEARSAFMALPLEKRRDVQVLLAAVGKWPAVANDGFGPKLLDAIRDFQTSVGRAPTGIVTDDDYDALLRSASPILRLWSMQRIKHPQTDAALWIPRGLVETTSVTDDGLALRSDQTGVTILFVFFPGSTLDSTLRTVSNTIRGMTIDYTMARPTFFVVSSHSSGASQYTRFQATRGGVVGFTLIWPSDSNIYGDRLSTVMSDFFRAENELGQRRVPPPPLTEVAMAPANAPTAPARPVSPPSSSNNPSASGRISSGSGFFVSTDKVLTNAHVVEGCQDVTVAVGGRPSGGIVLGRDSINDLALIETTARSPAIARLRSGVRLGEDIAVFGYPLSGLLASSGNFTKGTVTATAGMGDDTRRLQISAPVQPGNSGGPLLDESGNVVGVVVSKINAVAVAVVTDDIPQNVNFAIKAAIASSFLESKSIDYEVGAPGQPLKSADLAERAQSFAAAISCSP